MYFKNFPYTQYQFPDDNIRIIQNLSLRATIVEEFIADGTGLQEYMIEDGTTPEIIAFDEYGDANLHWTILLANNILNVYEDWPKSSAHLESVLKDKYRVQMVGDSEVTLTDTEVSEFIEYVGITGDSEGSSQFQSTMSNGLIKKPHHFEDEDGNYFSFETALGDAVDARGRTVIKPKLFPVSIYDYEFKKNEEKRVIAVPTRDNAIRMKRELGKLLNE